jgi:hypothetical protein
VARERRLQFHQLRTTRSGELPERLGATEQEHVVVLADDVVGRTGRVHVGGLRFTLRGRLDDRHVQQPEQFPRGVLDRPGEPLGLGRQPRRLDAVTAFLGGRAAFFGGLALFAATLHLVALQLGHAAVEDEHRREIVVKELRQPLHDPD